MKEGQGVKPTLPPVPGVDREVLARVARFASGVTTGLPFRALMIAYEGVSGDEGEALASDLRAILALVSPLEGKGSSSASSPAHVASATATETPCDLEALDPKRWEVSVNVDGANVLTIGSHGYLAGHSDIDRFGDAVRAAGEHLLSFIGAGEPAPCFYCMDDGGPCEVCGGAPSLPDSSCKSEGE